jgi:hypothetical protein
LIDRLGGKNNLAPSPSNEISSSRKKKVIRKEGGLGGESMHGYGKKREKETGRNEKEGERKNGPLLPPSNDR